MKSQIVLLTGKNIQAFVQMSLCWIYALTSNLIDSINASFYPRNIVSMEAIHMLLNLTSNLCRKHVYKTFVDLVLDKSHT